MSGRRPGFEANKFIGNILRYGVIISTLLIALGTLLSPLHIGSYGGNPASVAQVCRTDFGIINPNLLAVLQQASQLDPLSIIQLGVLVLLMVPFFRVAGSAMSFALAKESKFAVLAVVTLGVLLLSAFVVAPIEAGIW